MPVLTQYLQYCPDTKLIIKENRKEFSEVMDNKEFNKDNENAVSETATETTDMNVVAETDKVETSEVEIAATMTAKTETTEANTTAKIAGITTKVEKKPDNKDYNSNELNEQPDIHSEAIPKSFVFNNRLPEVKSVYSIIIVLNIAFIFGGLIAEIICFGMEAYTGQIVSAILMAVNAFCLGVLKNVINWYPQAKIEVKKDYLSYTYYVPGINKFTEYKIYEIENLRVAHDGIEITGNIKHRPAARMSFEDINKYKIHMNKKDQAVVIEMLKVFKSACFSRMFIEAYKDLTKIPENLFPDIEALHKAIQNSTANSTNSNVGSKTHNSKKKEKQERENPIYDKEKLETDIETVKREMKENKETTEIENIVATIRQPEAKVIEFPEKRENR